jgi:hypothetical protein
MKNKRITSNKSVSNLIICINKSINYTLLITINVIGVVVEDTSLIDITNNTIHLI